VPADMVIPGGRVPLLKVTTGAGLPLTATRCS